jgi:2'-5' RNA ligase
VNLRLFVALEPPDPVRRRLATAQGELRSAGGRHAEEVRWVAPDRMHLTLQFLGSVPEERLDAVREAVAEAAAASLPLRLEVRGAGGFPSARRPRAIWGGVAGDLEGLRALVLELGRALGPLGFPAGGRAFTPHFTFGRSRDGRGATGLGGAIAAAAVAEPVPWRVDEVVLFRSHLGQGGSRYEALLRAQLGPPGSAPG